MRSVSGVCQFREKNVLRRPPAAAKHRPYTRWTANPKGRLPYISRMTASPTSAPTAIPSRMSSR